MIEIPEKIWAMVLVQTEHDIKAGKAFFLTDHDKKKSWKMLATV